jgi:energy-coupling factor transport system substrate-specific component
LPVQALSAKEAKGGLQMETKYPAKRIRQFLTVFAAFVVLGASFKVMVLVEGLTEVRPVNAIPPVAGLISGPIGALACGLGNLIADLFGSFGWSSVLGLFANFLAAYLPYRLWHLFSAEPPNLHSGKNILRYIVICLISAFTTAWFLSFGLYTFFGLWLEEIYTYVFFNNFGFSIGFGMPLLIILTSDSVSINCQKRLPHLIFDRFNLKAPVGAAYLLLMLTVFICVFFLHLNPQEAPWMHALSAASLIGLICQCI